MHLYFFVRGIIPQIERFEMFMQAQMFLWERKNLKTGKKEITLVQGALRRMPFGYEYIFPEECLDEVLTMLKIDAKAKSIAGISGFKMSIIRKMIGGIVRPIPDYKKTASLFTFVKDNKGKLNPIPVDRYIELKGIILYPIGIKKDIRGILNFRIDEHGKEVWFPEGYEQEML